MATEKLFIDGIGEVKIFRRKGLKYLRISVGASGEVRLSVPWYVPKKTAIDYLNSKRDWLQKHTKATRASVIKNGSLLWGEDYLNIELSESKRIVSVESDNKLNLIIPKSYSREQKITKATKSIEKYLITKSEINITPILNNLANQFGFSYKSVRYKSLKSRWGSCDNNQNIVLNIGLIRLDEDLIEYVLVHELVHTKFLNHSKSFWDQVSNILPDFKVSRKMLRAKSPKFILEL